jgi:hypothetical protein
MIFLTEIGAATANVRFQENYFYCQHNGNFIMARKVAWSNLIQFSSYNSQTAYGSFFFSLMSLACIPHKGRYTYFNRTRYQQKSREIVKISVSSPIKRYGYTLPAVFCVDSREYRVETVLLTFSRFLHPHRVTHPVEKGT